MKRGLLGLGVVLLLVATLACEVQIPGITVVDEGPDTDGGGGQPTEAVPTSARPTTAPPPTSAPPPTTVPPTTDTGGATATLTLVNNSSSTVCFVYISPVSWSVWGDDWLGSSEVIGPGGSRVFNVPAGDYDMRADDCSHNELDVQWGVTLSGSMTWTITGGADGDGDGDGATATLTLRNNSDSTVCYVYISPVSWSVWGDDWLGSSEVISSGSSRVFNVPAGDYDMRADDCSHNQLDVQWGVTLSGSMTWTITGGTDGDGDGDGATATLTLRNNSGSTVCYVYISPVSWSVWGDDWLGSSEVISSGSSRVFNVPAGDYDMRADDCSHNQLDVQWGVTLSGSMTWTITGGGDGGDGGGTATLTLRNNSGSTVCYVYISPVSWSVWGDDWLGSSEVIGPGGSRVFNVPTGDYDMRADDCSHNQLDVQWGVTLSGSMTWTIQ